MLPYKIVKIDATNWKRPSWDEYFLKLAMLASERATCPRMHCGCVLVKDKYVLATGYNGSLPGTPHCYEDGCMVVNDHCVRTNHAEINAICQAGTRVKIWVSAFFPLILQLLSMAFTFLLAAVRIAWSR